MKNSENKRYFKIGLTAFLVIAASIILYFSIDRMNSLVHAINIATGIVTPFILGLLLAYFLCPLFNLIVKKTANVKWPKLLASKKDREPFLVFRKVIATIVSLLTFLALVAGILALFLPQLIDSIVSMIAYMPEGLETVMKWSQEIMKDQPEFDAIIDNLLKNSTDNITIWLEETLLNNYNVLINNISSGILGILGLIVDIFVAIIICIFFLNSKEIFAAQTKKLLFALLSKKKADDFLRGAVFVNKTFGGFINGKLLDSLIIGIICFVVMSIFNWPYVALISVIIGVTNIIPFFGPFIGAVPASILILIVDPMTCIYFVIFIIILQQVDGNIIGPKILGNSTGISSFWVLFAILVGGGIFGFVGMVMGIPIFAVVYAYVCYMVNKKLKKKGLSVNLEDYKYIYREKLEAGEERPTILDEKAMREKKKDIIERTPVDRNADNNEKK